jgi:membrane protease YdiL (CAAX protease family)
MEPSRLAIRLSERGMRILRFPAVRLILSLLFLVAFIGLAQGLSSLLEKITGMGPDGAAWIRMILTCSFAWFGYVFYCQTVEGRRVSELSLEKSGRQLLAGFLMGFGFISLVMLFMGLSGGYRITGTRDLDALLPFLVMAIQSGIVEEIFSRGILFRITEEGLGTWWAVLLSAFVFGFLHSWNPNATVFSSISIALTAGVILALLYVLTRKLWVPIGLHIGWNLTLGGIYGAPVSGGVPGGLLKSAFKGPDWLTGGAFGPEASVITLAVFLVTGAFLARRIILEKRGVDPLWRKNV